ncbi:MAG TPA: hypothetical protein PK156_48465 [Polyangium sp.]|nr:hypothetical protein [Polyangium sp.]
MKLTDEDLAVFVPMLRNAFLLVVLAVGICSPTVAVAQDPTPDKGRATSLYNEANVEMSQGNYASACPRLVQAQELWPDNVLMPIGLAKCHSGAGKLILALQDYDIARQLAVSQNNSQRIAKIDAEIDALKPRLGKLLIPVSSNVSKFRDAVVSLDGTPIPQIQWNQPITVDPGDHEIEVSASGQTPLKIPVQVPEGKETTAPSVAPPWIPPSTEARPPTPADPPKNPSVTIPPTNPTPIAPTVDDSSKTTSLRKDSKTSEGSSGMRVGGQVLLVIGGGSFLVGSALGILAISKYSSASDDGHCDANDVCDAVGTQLRNNAKSFGYGSGVSFAIAIPSLIVGGVLFSKSPPAPKSNRPPPVLGNLWIGPSGVGLTGQW